MELATPNKHTESAKAGDTANWYLATDAMQAEFDGSLRNDPGNYTQAYESAMNMCFEVTLGVAETWKSYGHEFPKRQYASESIAEFMKRNPCTIAPKNNEVQ